MTKEQLAKYGITIDKDEIDDAEGYALIEKHIKSLNDEKTRISAEKDKFKKSIDDLSKENAEYKRKEKDRMSDEEKEKQRIADIEAQNLELQKKVALNDKVSELMAIGYDKELATKYATAEIEGKSTVEFQKKFIDGKLEAQKKELLKNGGGDPNLGDPNHQNEKFTKENFKKGLITMEEMNKLKETNPTLYAEILKA